MIDPKKFAALDQAQAQFIEVTPPWIFSLFKRFVLLGFSGDQAFVLARDEWLHVLADIHKPCPPEEPQA